MTHHHDRPRIAAQMALQPDTGFQIQMVGRLVQQQQVGLREQQRCQGHPHAPAAGKRIAGTLLLAFGEPQPGKNARGARRCAMSVHIHQAGVNVGDPAGVAGGLGFGSERNQLLVGGQNRIDQVAGASGCLLAGHSYLASAPAARRPLRRAARFAGDQPQQGRLAGAVASDQPHPMARD